MRNVIGVLPMGGTGSRLGLPFHKALAPTFTEHGIKPLYWHSLDKLLRVTGRVYTPGLRIFDEPHVTPGGFQRVVGNTMEETLRNFAEGVEGTTIIAMLPDTIALRDSVVEDAYAYYQRLEYDPMLVMAVLMDPADEDQLDPYVNGEFRPHAPGFKNAGWGFIIGEAEWFADLDPKQPISYQLNKGHHTYRTSSIIFDLGTPERYERYISVRKSYRANK